MYIEYGGSNGKLNPYLSLKSLPSDTQMYANFAGYWVILLAKLLINSIKEERI